MRSLVMALVVVGLLAAPSLGVINVKLTTDAPAPVLPGAVVTVSIWAQGTAAGIASLGGKVNATGPAATLVSNAGSFAWVDGFVSPAPFASTYGSPAANGGWNGVGSQQSNYLAPDSTFGKADYVKLASYTVTAQNVTLPSTVDLAFASGTYGGFRPVETNKATTLGTITGASITVLPEPATMVLLALGGLLVARRRSH